MGVDRMQRKFGPMRKQVEAWRQSELRDATAKIIIYQAFIEGELDVPKHLARRVYDYYFEPAFEEFKPRTVWSLSNAFTSALKELGPIRSSRQRQSWAVSWGPLQGKLLGQSIKQRGRARALAPVTLTSENLGMSQRSRVVYADFLKADLAGRILSSNRNCRDGNDSNERSKR